MAAHHTPQSLPSFAQAFSPSSLSNNIHSSNSLPPIQARASFERFHRVGTPSSRQPSVEQGASHSNGRKRSREEDSSASNPASARQSPRIRVKEEDDHDMLDTTPAPPSPSRPVQPRLSQEMTDAPAPSLLVPSSKKRRVNVSNGPHTLGLNIDVNAPASEPPGTTPISPAVMGFTIGRDDPAAIEQVRSMLTVKQKQKALIEQRRGSVAGVMNANPSIVSPIENRRGSVAGILTVPSSGDSPRPPTLTRLSSSGAPNSSEDRPVPKPSTSVRNARRSPNMGNIVGNSRRITSTAAPSSQVRPASPSAMVVPSQQTQPAPNQQLPPPPISFARRRAGQFSQGKNKPADIVISPREAQSPDQLAPSIQSAPPVPHAQGQSIGRLAMTLPRLPSAMGDSQKIQRVVSGKVPPTPTRLTVQRGSLTTASGTTGQSPPGAFIPISTTLVPPTPTSLHRAGYVGEKSAFLAPFEMFYDSLNDSKQLKHWLSEQLQKSNTLMQSLQHQQEKMDEIVEHAVEQRMGSMRDEIASLHQKVEELEGAFRLESGRRLSVDTFGGGKGMGKFVTRNGILPTPELPAAYTFPPVETPKPEFPRRMSSPGWGHEPDREVRGSERPPNSAASNRFEPLRPQPIESSQSRRPQSQSRSGLGYPETTVKTTTTSSSRSSRPPQLHDRLNLSTYRRSISDSNGVGKPAEEALSTSAGTSRRDVIMSPPQDMRRAPADEA